MKEKVLLGHLLGDDLEEDFISFDLTEIQDVLFSLKEIDPIDLPHAELLQQKSLRGADLICEYLGKVVKTVGYLEAKVNSTRNKVSLEYQAPEGKTTADMKKWAGDSSKEVEDILIKLSKAKASKVVLEKKYDILIRSHHHYKDIASGLRRTVLGYSNISRDKIPEGYE